MDWEQKIFVKEYFKVMALFISIVAAISLMVFGILYDHKKNVERVQIESEYSWFLEQSSKIELMADYLNSLEIDDSKYEGAKEIFELTVLEYNVKAVMLLPREKWNCVAPYQYSAVELLYRGVARDVMINGRDLP